MPRRVCVVDLPGLSRNLLGAVPANSALAKWMSAKPVFDLTPSWPAVTCSVQATLTTGVSPSRHGIIANGIATYRSHEDQRLTDGSNFASYRRDVSFWEQSNQFLDAPRFWQDPATRASRWKTAMLFFQHSMPGIVEPLQPAADIVLTPKPEHGPDGSLTSLCWSEPHDLVDRLFTQIGPFPLMNYWGPLAGIESSKWIARAAEFVWREQPSQLQLVYVPHLDYDLQRFGPDSAQAAKAVADMCAALEPLIDCVTSQPDAELVLLSEYSMTQVSQVIHPNRLLADAGLLVTRESPDGTLIDYARSVAFAMADHQIAHVYIGDTRRMADVKHVLSKDSGLHAVAVPHGIVA